MHGGCQSRETAEESQGILSFPNLLTIQTSSPNSLLLVSLVLRPHCKLAAEETMDMASKALSLHHVNSPEPHIILLVFSVRI